VLYPLSYEGGGCRPLGRKPSRPAASKVSLGEEGVAARGCRYTCEQDTLDGIPQAGSSGSASM
jgi:hypothetical protein